MLQEVNRFTNHLNTHCFMQCAVYTFSLHSIHSTTRVHSGPLGKGFRISNPQRNAMGQSTEMSLLVSMLFWIFLNPLKF